MTSPQVSRPNGGSTSILTSGGGFTVIGSALLTVPTPAPSGLFGNAFGTAPQSLSVPTPAPSGSMPADLFDPPHSLAVTAPAPSGGLAVDPDGAATSVTVSISMTPTFTVT